jgi:hypothetical protein
MATLFFLFVVYGLDFTVRSQRAASFTRTRHDFSSSSGLPPCSPLLSFSMWWSRFVTASRMTWGFPSTL